MALVAIEVDKETKEETEPPLACLRVKNTTKNITPAPGVIFTILSFGSDRRVYNRYYESFDC